MILKSIKHRRFAAVAKLMESNDLAFPGYETMEIEELKSLLIAKFTILNGKPVSRYAKRSGYHNHHIIPCHKFLLKRDDPAAHLPENLLWVTIPQHELLHLLDFCESPRNGAAKETVRRWSWDEEGNRKPPRKTRRERNEEMDQPGYIPTTEAETKTFKKRQRAHLKK